MLLKSLLLIASLLAIATGLGFVLTAMRRGSCKHDFDWRLPTATGGESEAKYAYCEYENRFAYTLGSIHDKVASVQNVHGRLTESKTTTIG